MPVPTDDSKKGEFVEDTLQRPHREAFDTVEEYLAGVRQYWKTISRYQDRALALHRDIMAGNKPSVARDKEKRSPK